ncbi:hypothetical protein V8F33_007292 [Rhypophila sp. PSN 637]
MIPEDIIHADFELEYVTSVRNVVVDGTADPNWSGTFCKLLRQVMAHTMWMHNPVLLATALQYMDVILSNDHRPWMGDTDGPAFDPFPHMLQELSREAGGADISELRKSIVEDEYDGSVASLWNILFERIEEVVYHRLKTKGRERPIAQRDADEHNKVSIQHLEILIEALDTMSYCGFPCWMPVEFVSPAIGGARSKHDFPLVKDDSDEEDEDDLPTPAKRGSEGRRTSKKSSRGNNDNDEDDDEGDLPKTATPGSKGRRASKKPSTVDDEDEDYSPKSAIRGFQDVSSSDQSSIADNDEFNGMYQEEMSLDEVNPESDQEVDLDQEPHSDSGPDTVTHVTYDDFHTRGVPYLNGEMSEDSQTEDYDVGQGPHQESLSGQASALKRKASQEGDPPVKKAKTAEESPEFPSPSGNQAVAETATPGEEPVTGTAMLGQETPVQLPEECYESQVQSSIQGGEDATSGQDTSMGDPHNVHEEARMIFYHGYMPSFEEYF